ncbi:MAG: hypothetical protein Kow0092_31760 [Deferrisomatales bacterium]
MGMGAEKQSLVMDLFAQDVATGLEAAVGERRQEVVGFVERVWEKYRLTLAALREDRLRSEALLGRFLEQIGYQ